MMKGRRYCEEKGYAGEKNEGIVYCSEMVVGVMTITHID